jgi:hypothetical protein
MPVSLQWLICAALGLFALAWLLQHYRLWPWVKRAGGDAGCGSGCAHCDVAKQAAPSATLGSGKPS